MIRLSLTEAEQWLWGADSG